MDNNPTTRLREEPKTIVTCELCLQKLRIPKRRKKIRVTCPKCRYEFIYQYYGLGLSSIHQKRILSFIRRLRLSDRQKKRHKIGLNASLPGAFVVELVVLAQPFSTANPWIAAMVLMATFAAGLGMALETARVLSLKRQGSLYRGFIVRAGISFLGGFVSGLLAQLVFSGILSIASLMPQTLLLSAATKPTSFLLPLMFARTLSWGLLGFLLVLSFGINAETSGDWKPRLLAGIVGGAIGGILFDPLQLVVPLGQGTLGRILGFSMLGMAVALASLRFRIIEYNKPSNAPAPHVPVTSRRSISIAGPLLTLLGLVLVLLGTCLVAGNITGAFPTFPFAGYFTSGAGALALNAGLKMWE
ncbi:MAG: hypothetical protein P8129_03755 [Anaerolineae bacterium]